MLSLLAGLFGGEVLNHPKYIQKTKQSRLYIPPPEIEKYNSALKAVKTNQLINIVDKTI